MKVTEINLVENLINYESGELTDNKTIELFSYLVKTGRAWTFQGHYGRTATDLIDEGYINREGKILKKVIG